MTGMLPLSMAPPSPVLLATPGAIPPSPMGGASRIHSARSIASHSPAAHGVALVRVSGQREHKSKTSNIQ